jgi:transposase
MAMGKRDNAQESIWVDTSSLRSQTGHVFYETLNEVFKKHRFDEFVEKTCAKYYHESMGRPSIAPGVYFRMLMVGYFEGLESERGIAWRVADSLGLRGFLGLELGKNPPDHSSVSRTRRLMEIETHQEVFDWVLMVLALEGLVKGKTLGVDATTLEANAALKSIVRRDTDEGYQDFLKRLAKESGIETPSRAELARMDRKRKKKGSNKDWEHPDDPDAKIGKMKDGRTHLLHKAEHAVDLETQAVVAVGLGDGDEGDTMSLPWTLMAAKLNLEKTAKDKKARENLSPNLAREVVADKGYHSNDELVYLKEEGVRTFIAEPERGQRNWIGKLLEKMAVYGNRQRIESERGKALMKLRAEIVERSFAHCYESGAMRRLHLRERGNILKRLLIHVGAFNMSLVMRELVGYGTPRGLRSAMARAAARLGTIFGALCAFVARAWEFSRNQAQPVAAPELA